MNESLITCPICKLINQKAYYNNDYERIPHVQCNRCGNYSIDDGAQTKIGDKKQSPKLIAWIRDLHEQEAIPPEITSQLLENIEGNLPNYIPTQRILILLRNIAKQTQFPGRAVTVVPENDYPLAWAANEEELIYYLESLIARRLLFSTHNNNSISKLINSVRITAAGWEYLERNAKTASISNQAFVAMSFSSKLNPIWTDAIKIGIENAGYSAYRIGVEPHSDRIDTKIMAEIRNSRFLVADVTEQRQGVYFEAGYALGLGLPVIWSCRKDELKKVHFDTRQYNHIVWEKTEELKEDLYNFICAIIGKISKR